MKKIREWLLLDLWAKLWMRNLRSKRMQREIRRCLKYKIKYETSKQMADYLRIEFCKQYPDSPLNKYK